MDENTLNDLLECSVCLERLDTTSKVLPCQHTFCRKCLEIIVASHGELRCPECRVLIEIKIDDLPPNVLLMRILGGMKSVTNQNAPSKAPTDATHTHTAVNNASPSISSTQTHQRNRPTHLDTTAHSNTHQHPPANHQPLIGSGQMSSNQYHPPPLFSKQYPNSISMPHARAVFDFTSKENGDLSFKKGDHIVLRKRLDLNWYVGEVNGNEGAFPVNHVQIIVPLPQPQCKALYDFRMGPNEEEGCLTFKKGAIINVFRRVDQNWAEGRFCDCIGIFPIAFVEMNTLAKQIMDNNGTCAPIATTSARNVPPTPAGNNDSSSDSSSTLTNSTCSNSSSSTSSTPTSPTAHVVVRQTTAGAKSSNEHKRHSFNVLTSGLHSVVVSAGSSLLQSNRHSAEILCAPDPPEPGQKSPRPSPTIVHQHDNKTRTHTRRSHPNTHYDSASGSSTSHANSRTTTKIVNIPEPSGLATSLPANYVALYPYKPQKSDELELKKGSVYYVTERCQDGWFKGTNRNNKSGVFPGNYVALLRNNRDHNKMLNLKRQSTIAPTSIGPSNGTNSNQAAHGSGSTPLSDSMPGPNSNNSTVVPPPELPPRSSATTSSESVWTKPLGQHVESFFSRKSGHGQSNKTTDSSGSKEKKESSSPSAVSLMKRLTNIKRSKSPTASAAYSMDNPVFEDCLVGASGSSGPVVQKRTGALNHVHVRSGSCPSQLLQTLPLDVTHMSSTAEHPVFGSHRIKGHKERPILQGLRHGLESVRGRGNVSETSNTSSPVHPHHSHSRSHIAHTGTSSHSSHHRKSHSLDATTIASHLSHQANKYNKPHQQNNPKERYRCIVPYPPNSEFELELQLDDIVFVHKKRENGWYKGTHSRTGKIGLFPASFVQKDD